MNDFNLRNIKLRPLGVMDPERLNALIRLDIEWARRQMPHLSDEILLLGMHKARYICTAIPAEFRHASAHFLRENNSTSLYGEPILPEGELPV